MELQCHKYNNRYSSMPSRYSIIIWNETILEAMKTRHLRHILSSRKRQHNLYWSILLWCIFKKSFQHFAHTMCYVDYIIGKNVDSQLSKAVSNVPIGFISILLKSGFTSCTKGFIEMIPSSSKKHALNAKYNWQELDHQTSKECMRHGHWKLKHQTFAW